MSSVRAIFEVVRERGGKLVPMLHSAKLVQCPEADREHAASWRQFAHTNHHDHSICYSGALEDLEDGWKLGIIAHEFGHVMAIGLDIRHTEEDANRFGGVIVGTRVSFRGPHRLEWAEPMGILR